MGIGYIVVASCPGTSCSLRFQACLTVYSHWASRVGFSQRSHTTWHTFVENVANCIKSRIVWLPHPVTDVQFFIFKTYERHSN